MEEEDVWVGQAMRRVSLTYARADHCVLDVHLYAVPV